MAWASFPCQDLSLAGKGRGLEGDRSGSFWGFWRLMEGLIDAGRAVPIIALENVTGAISANKGEDFRVLLETLTESGYRVGPMVINAIHFIPQSRPRLFIIGVKDDYPIPAELIHEWPTPLWHPDALKRAYGRMSKTIRNRWIWWRTPAPPPRQSKLIDVIEEEPTGVQWHTPEQTQRLLDLMSDLHRNRVHAVQATGKRAVGTIYKRIRRDKEGNRMQRAEIRLDDVSGCLRTALGGSSRQIVMIIEGNRIRSRLLSPREGARLMGLPDSYILPEKYNEAFNLLGDGLAVPVVSWLEQYIFTPLAEQAPPPRIEYPVYLEFAVDSIAVGL
jgi:DNA (cytosine-5)-methyltransferase 1